MLAPIARTCAVPLTALLESGRARPGWSLRYRYAIATMRIWFDWAAHAPPLHGRALMDSLSPTPRVEGVSVRCDQVAGVPGRWAEPATPVSRSVLYLHGGGYRVGSSRSHLGVTLSIARAGWRVFSADYRMAPEHPFPAALDDAVAAYRGLLALGHAPQRLVVGGDSAGGGLAAALLISLRDQGLPLPAGAFLISPWVDLTHPGASITTNAPYDYLQPDLLEVVASSYAGSMDRRDPRISPAYGELRGLPPLLIQVGGAELFRDDVVRFHGRAVAAGVAARLALWDDQVHVWHAFAVFHEPGRAALAQINEFSATCVPAAAPCVSPAPLSVS